ncbi:Acetyltransferase, GNAT family [hydrothermal vent metagenome]|uniref:Acetyltransferase, GNAT family n=1 Tax=hydrothermal vent metagenome TaxID=652676 RepID=A0A3B1AML5_9ZZZZ
MSGLIEIKTNRLFLRQWRLNDFQFFSKINASKVVMKYFTNTLTQAQGNQLAITIQQRILENGWGLWAAEIPNVCEFIGFVGLNRLTYPLPFSPCVEIGWRLDEKYWGKD